MSNSCALLAEDIRVETARGVSLLEDVSLCVGRGEALGIVGESGSGKTTTALALMGGAPSGARVVSGSVTVSGMNVLGLPERQLRKVRGVLIGYVPQNPALALNPALKVETLIRDVLRHRNSWNTGWGYRRNAFRSHAMELLAQAGLPDDATILTRYPHQLSGGQQQRIAIAAAMACEPEVLILDEPATALDVVTESSVIGEIQRRQRSAGTAIVYLTHDLGVVGNFADKITVLYCGAVVEEGSVSEVLHTPRHPYTRTLLAAAPVVDTDESPPPMKVRCDPEHHVSSPLPVSSNAAASGSIAPAREILRVDSLRASHLLSGNHQDAVRGVDLSVRAGECFALVGESGSGKSTLARCIVGLHEPNAGTVTLANELLPANARKRSLQQLRSVQLIFQDPAGSLNPRQKVGSQLGQQAKSLRGLSQKDSEVEARRLLREVHLAKNIAERYPQELSGGEQQRVAIARALAAEPDLLICDEITSSLDVSVQAVIVDLLAELRSTRALSLLFITHDLGLVSDVANHVGVMDKGTIAEEGLASGVLAQPGSTAAQRLLSAASWKKLGTNETNERKKG